MIERRKGIYYDRRSGEDRRNTYSLSYFDQGNPDRRSDKERRRNVERRDGYVRISEWSSARIQNGRNVGESVDGDIIGKK